jgi:putative inorganic carbon (hco3(-)) transporter
MRDLAFLIAMGVALPMSFIHPWMGVMLWTWISIMNPHRLVWSVSDWPFAAATAGVTMLGLIFTRDKKHFPFTPLTFSLMLFVLWVLVAVNFSIDKDPYTEMLSRVLKIQIMIFVALIALTEKRHIIWLTGVLCASIAFYGVKGGIFTLATGGAFLVWGPYGSFIEGNNEIALAIILVIPLMFFFVGYTKNKWIKLGLFAAMGLSVIASLGSHSRGALLGMAAMVMMLWWRSGKRLVLAPILAAFGISVLLFMPQDWWDRMATISTYEEDTSAMGRINAWHAMWNIATDRFFGGGFKIYNVETFARYAPNPEDVHAAHSIYFQILGEHGFVGLFLFLLVGALTWLNASWIRRNARKVQDMQWAGSLASMCQVSMFGFAVGGAFLSLAYFDLPYNILIIVVITRKLVEARLAELKEKEEPRHAMHPAWASPS